MQKMLQSTFSIFLLITLFGPIGIKAQYGGQMLNFPNGTNAHVRIANDVSLDIGGAFSIEAWVRWESPDLTDNKFFSKAGPGFPLTSAYVLGIVNSKVVFEVYNQETNVRVVISDELPANRWTHIAATYNHNGQQRLYVNGVLVAENNSLGGTMTSNASDVICGVAPWNINDKAFEGDLEELRFYQSELSVETIKDWMLRDVTTDHPNYASLSLYHKYDDGVGLTVTNSGANTTNKGTLVNGPTWQTSNTPFVGPQVQLVNQTDHAGIWPGVVSDTSDILAFSGNLSGNESVIFVSDVDIYGYDLASSAPTGYDNSMDGWWSTMVQGNPVIDISFDATVVDLSNIAEVVLISFNGNDPALGTVTPGTFSEDAIEFSNIEIEDFKIYTLGVKYGNTTNTALSNTKPPSEYTIVPTGHIVPWQFESELINLGPISIADVEVKVEVRKAGVLVHEQMIGTQATLGSGEFATFSQASTYTPDEGDYVIKYIASSSGDDTDISDNEVEFNFTISNDTYARDDGNYIDGLGGAGQPAILGQLFDFEELTNIKVINLSHRGGVEGETIQALIYSTNPDGSPSQLIATSETYNIPTTLNGVDDIEVSLNFATPVFLDAGSYFFGIEQMGNNNIFLSYSLDIFTESKTWASIDNASTWGTIESFGFEVALNIRPVLGVVCSVGQLTSPAIQTVCGDSENFMINFDDNTVLPPGAVYQAIFEPGVDAPAGSTGFGLGPLIQNSTLNSTLNGAAGSLIGTWTVTGIIFHNGSACSSTDPITVEFSPALEVSENITDETIDGAADGAIALAVSGGIGTYSYSWDNGNNTPTISGLEDGAYTVVVSDDYGCEFTATYTVEAGMVSTVAELAGVNEMRLFPNPTSSKAMLILGLDYAMEAQIQILDMTGKLMTQQQAQPAMAFNFEIDLADYPAGIYMAKINLEGRTMTRRLIKL